MRSSAAQFLSAPAAAGQHAFQANSPAVSPASNKDAMERPPDVKWSRCQGRDKQTSATSLSVVDLLKRQGAHAAVDSTDAAHRGPSFPPLSSTAAEEGGVEVTKPLAYVPSPSAAALSSFGVNGAQSTKSRGARGSGGVPRPVTIRQLFRSVMCEDDTATEAEWTELGWTPSYQSSSTTVKGGGATGVQFLGPEHSSHSEKPFTERTALQHPPLLRTPRDTAMPLEQKPEGEHTESSAAHTSDEGDAPSTATTFSASVLRGRLGEATVAVDAAPCSRVTLCGRVVARVGPAANGSLRSCRPFSLYVVSDCTGMVGVQQYHTMFYEVDEESAVEEERQRCSGHAAETTAAQKGLLSAYRAEHTARDEPYSPTSEAASHSPHPFLSSGVPRKAMDGPFTSPPAATSAATHDTQTEALPRTFPVHQYREMSSPFFTGTVTAFPLDTAYRRVAPAELDIVVGDYVVCVGRLSFADVNPDVAKLFSIVPLPRYASRAVIEPEASSRVPSGVQAAMTETSEKAEAVTAPSSALAANPEACRTTALYGQGKPYVLLPGAEEPIRVEELAVLGLVGSVSGAVFLTTEEAERASRGNDFTDEETKTSKSAVHAEGTSCEPSVTCFCSGVSMRGERNPPASAAEKGVSTDSPSIMPFCVIGQVRLVSDSNEGPFWWLSAMETHVRLCAPDSIVHHAQRKPPLSS